MTVYELDETDRQLLNLLQDNARYTAIELAEAIGVSDNTIHNRMDRLEEVGVITGYSTSVDYERTGFDRYFHFTCTARISDRSTVADQAAKIPAVIEVMELMTGQENLHIKGVGTTDDDITEIAEKLDELSLEINDENLIRSEQKLSLDLVTIAASDDE